MDHTRVLVEYEIYRFFIEAVRKLIWSFLAQHLKRSQDFWILPIRKDKWLPKNDFKKRQQNSSTEKQLTSDVNRNEKSVYLQR